MLFSYSFNLFAYLKQNYEDSITEIYMVKILQEIDDIVWSKTPKIDKLNQTEIDLPKNLIAECHVWRQKFRMKR